MTIVIVFMAKGARTNQDMNVPAISTNEMNIFTFVEKASVLSMFCYYAPRRFEKKKDFKNKHHS